MVKNKIKELYKKIDNLNEPFDLSKKYPDYIRTYYFKGAFIFITLCFFVLLGIYGFDSEVYIPCPEDANTQCTNPFVYCVDDPLYRECLPFSDIECKGRNCDSLYIKQGDYIGIPIPKSIKFFPLFSVGMIIISFILNHIGYLWRKNANNNNK